jgi:S-DNA-T family DNA segregation ATPase FtsK/SpoIIIE
MKDSAVGPVGLFNTRRQKRLLDGLGQRFKTCLDQQQVLRSQHADEREAEERELSQQRADTTAECRAKRRDMLRQWDDADEQLTSHYEWTSIENRQEIGRLSVRFRRQAEEEQKAIERKVEARRQAVLQQHENCKNQPRQQKRIEIKRIDELLSPTSALLDQGRQLTIRRLAQLPEVKPVEHPEDDMRQPRPESVEQALNTISMLGDQCKEVVNEMQSGAASRMVFFLPGLVAVIAIAWAVVAHLKELDPKVLWMLAGTIPAGVIGFVVYLILLWPLNRMTRRLYPKLERIAQAVDECAVAGRKIAAQIAADSSAQLVRRRDSQIEAAQRWGKEQHAESEQRLLTEQEALRLQLTRALEDADRTYTDTYARVGNEMRTKADSLATSISDLLVDTDRKLKQRREENAAQRYAQLQRLAHRLKEGVTRGLDRIIASDDQVRGRFPDWEQVLASDQVVHDQVEFLPIGRLRVDESIRAMLSRRDEPADDGPADDESDDEPADDESGTAHGNGSADDEQIPELLADAQIPDSIPVVLHRRLHSCVVIETPQAHIDRAIDVAHQMLWRLLSGAPPAQAKLTLIDPLGRGQHFTNFMALADHDPSLVGHRVWTTDNKIDARLGELAHHAEDVLQASLRDRFERIEDYNEVAGSMAEPYRAVAAVGFPEALSRDGYRHLRALIESGVRCGIFTVLVCDDSNPWPSDIPLPGGDKVLRLKIDQDGNWQLQTDQLETLPFVPESPPPVALRRELVERIGKATVAASRVEISLDSILASDLEASGSTTDDVAIVIGSQGANRSLSLRLGEGVRQHVLIAGKTGSGKSTLLHSIITSGAYHYRPDELQYYLLDFKKGVEFKPYADSGMPHARVIGIESEREFGRSVLQRLDEELQQRGEKFRAAGAQELGEYREASGQTMPRIMLVIDEFQELFVRDDRLAGDCTMLLDRLVRQGRSFGMHVVLSSQSLAGAYSLPRATLGQMAVRIAMQCSESDAALILSDDNTAARLISRPGEAIYNDAGGLIEGNQPFQVAWLTSKRHRQMLDEIAGRDQSYTDQFSPPVIFEGNRPCRWTAALAGACQDDSGRLRGLLGESVEIGPPLSVELSRNTGRNILLITPAESRGPIIASVLSSLAKSDPRLEIVYFDGARTDDASSLAPWLSAVGLPTRLVKYRDSEAEMQALGQLIAERGDEADDVAPKLIVIDPLERFRDLRQDESFNFSLDAPSGGVSGGAALQNVLRDGPPANVFVFLVCGSAETLTRWLPRPAQHDLELRILGQMNPSDSSLLIDSPMAADLSAATMLLYDDADGRINKFRQCDLPDAEAVKQWLGG